MIQLYPQDHGQWGFPPEGWIAFWDDIVDEVYGFTFSSDYGVQIADGSSTNFRFKVPAGQSSISFHVR